MIQLEENKIDLMAILEQDDEDCFDLAEEDIDFDSPSAAAVVPPEVGQTSVRSAVAGPSSNSGDVSGLASDDTSLDLSWPEYLQKVKETFIKARPLADVQMIAGAMPFKDWMDYVVKLMPKDIKIQGEVNFKHLVAELGPIDKSQYMLVEPVTDAEFCEVV